jgi:hypothetical protein
MITRSELRQLSTSEVEEVSVMCGTILRERMQSEPMTFDRLRSYKKTISPQKFSPYFESQWRKFMGLEKYSGSIYGPFDGVTPNGSKTYENKYATYDETRGASFPQIIRLDVLPDEYFIVIFFGEDLEIYRVPGKEMHASIIRRSATLAHANNDNELRINIKRGTEQMNFLESYRDAVLESKFKKHIFDSPKA